MNQKALAFMLFAFLLPAVATAGSYSSYGPIYASYKMSPAKGGGCISGSIGNAIPGKQWNSAITFVSEENSKSTLKQGAFGYTEGNSKKDFAPGLSTFTMCLKPGRYQIFGIATGTVYSKNRVAIPFEVVAGKNIYLGSFVFEGHGVNPECQQRASTVYVDVRDDFERDSPFITGSKEGRGLPLEKRMVDPANGAPYFVSCGQAGV